jgi:small ligand-binding sensory domain FIST
VTAIAAGLSTRAETAAAAGEAARRARDDLRRAADLALVFCSESHAQHTQDAAAAVRRELDPVHLLGCAAQGVVVGASELESGPAVAVWAASLPSAGIEPFHLDGPAAAVPGLEGASLVILLADPYSFPVEPLLARLGPVPVVGGLAGQTLIVGDEVVAHGAVGAVLSGVRVRLLVSQGCAPIGREAVVTRADGNVVFELAGERALDRIRGDFASLPPDQLRLAQRGLLAGLVIDENRVEYGRGDYLMRALLGADEASGAIAVGAPVRVGQTMRLHVRDAASADEDLRRALAEVAGEPVAGALVFTCNGRGSHMFDEPSHDARLVSEALETNALAGFFCGGEIGPVGGVPFLHGFTATLAVFLAD